MFKGITALQQSGLRDSANPLRELFDAAARGYNLKLSCRGCGRVEILDRFAVWGLFQRNGWRDWLRDVPAHFRCRGCDRKGPALDLVYDEPTSTVLPMPNRVRLEAGTKAPAVSSSTPGQGGVISAIADVGS